MRYEAVYTDRFGGDLNFAWANRAYFDAPDTASDALLIRRAKRALGLKGRHIKRWGGVDIRADFIGAHTALLISPEYA